MRVPSVGSPLIALPPELEDGYLIHSAVLARKLDVLLLPRQVLLAGLPGQGVGTVSFVHGVPQASTAAGVTHARDKRMTRYLLNIEKLPTAPGISFSSRGMKSLNRFVSRVGYPLILREAIGESPSIKTRDIWMKAELLAAISQMRLLAEDRFLPARSLVASAYGENMLSFSQDEQGRRVAPPYERLLVEKSMSGRWVRCLVCCGEMLAAVEFEQSVRKPKADISARLHKGFTAIALRAATAIPGLFAASIDLVLGDPARDPERQAYYVVDVSERLRLDSYAGASPELGPALADTLLVRQAEKSSLPLEEPAEKIALRVRLEGLQQPNQLLPLFADSCNALRLSGFMGLVDRMEGIVEGHIQGAPREVALVMEALLSGVHFGQRVGAADEWQAEVERHTDFKIVQS